MSEQENIRLAEKWIEALNAHDVGLFDQYRAPEYVADIPTFPGPVGVAEEVVFTQGLFEAFPDMHADMNQRIAQGDFVVVNLTFTGTNSGPLAMPGRPTMPATGKKVTVPVSNTFEFADGKIVRNSIYYDQVTMMAQLGVMPGM